MTARGSVAKVCCGSERVVPLRERQAEVEARWDAIVVENYAKAKALAEEATEM